MSDSRLAAMPGLGNPSLVAGPPDATTEDARPVLPCMQKPSTPVALSRTSGIVVALRALRRSRSCQTARISRDARHVLAAQAATKALYLVSQSPADQDRSRAQSFVLEPSAQVVSRRAVEQPSKSRLNAGFVPQRGSL
jgi:hypothetical protein